MLLVTPKAHLTPRASKEVAFSYDHFPHQDIQHKMWYVHLNESESRICDVNFSVGQNFDILKISE